MKKRHPKIKKLNELARLVEALKKDGKKIVLCHGVFDLIHPGHIRHLVSAKKFGDILIVSITADEFVKKGPERPVFRQELRAEVLSSIEPVDYVTVVENDSSIDAIAKIKPNFYVKGPDYKTRKKISFIPRKLTLEEETVRQYGGKLVYTEDKVVFSSSKLINDYLDVYPEATKNYLDLIKKKYSDDYIFERLVSLRKLKILVIGDAIIDQYHYCVPLGKSSKEPVMVHQYTNEESFLGGSLATANHLASVSNNITVVTILGKKRSFRSLILKNLKPAVKPVFFYQNGANTIIKRRYLYAFTQQKLFQISYIKDELIPRELSAKIYRFLNREIKNYDLVVVNDYGHGFFTDRIIRLICNKANYLALNVQANSANYGFNVITKYPRANFVCIDEQEIRLATHDKYSALEPLIKTIYKKMKCDYMIVTKGHKGSVSYSKNLGLLESPALTERIVDRVGAGDALFAISAPCVFASLDSDIVSFLGNIAGALQVQVVGNREPIEFDTMARFITRLLK